MNYEWYMVANLTRGDREMQILLIGYIVVSFAEIFTVGGILSSAEDIKTVQVGYC